MMKITLWRKPGCVQCDQTEREFNKRGIIYQVKRLDRSPKAVERFLALGFMSAPIVETDLKRWSGFRLEKIKSLEYHLNNERRQGINVPLQPLPQIADEVEDEVL
jgi:glutaredoxin-like protein NrdH